MLHRLGNWSACIRQLVLCLVFPPQMSLPQLWPFHSVNLSTPSPLIPLMPPPLVFSDSVTSLTPPSFSSPTQTMYAGSHPLWQYPLVQHLPLWTHTESVFSLCLWVFVERSCKVVGCVCHAYVATVKVSACCTVEASPTVRHVDYSQI